LGVINTPIGIFAVNWIFMSRILLRCVGLAAVLGVLFLTYRHLAVSADAPVDVAQTASANAVQVADTVVDAAYPGA
jgi:hypothetical protein